MKLPALSLLLALSAMASASVVKDDLTVGVEGLVEPSVNPVPLASDLVLAEEEEPQFDDEDGEEVEVGDDDEEVEVGEDEPVGPAVEDLSIQPMPVPVPPREEETKEVCHTELVGESGRFATKNFPSPYEMNSNCSWNITVPEGFRVQLTFHLFSVEHNPQCVWDSVRVVDTTGHLLKHLCGVLHQDLIVLSTGRTMHVNFTSDQAVDQAGFLASWKARPIHSEQPAIADQRPRAQQPGYLVTFPQSFSKAVDAAPGEVCLQMFNVAECGQVTVSVYDDKTLINGTAPVSHSFAHAGFGEIQCASVKLPEDFADRRAVVEVVGEFKDIGYSLLSYKSVGVVSSEPLVLIQTDKADYRPKQKVRARVLLTDFELKPAPQTEEVHEMWVTNPSGDRLAQWKQVALTRGIAQVEMDLPEEPILGIWTIHVKVNEDDEQSDFVTADFAVNENVLPKFEVTIESPSVLLRGDEEADFQICAKYTHGGKVRGALNATFHTSFPLGAYWRAPKARRNVTQFTDLGADGCSTVTLNSTHIKYLNTHSADLKVTAIVTEAGTGTSQNATDALTVKYTPFQISPEGSAGTHVVGGFPYVGDFRVLGHDDKPMAGVNLSVCARLFTSLADLRKLVSRSNWYSFNEDQILGLADRLKLLRYREVCGDYKSDGEGRFSVAVPFNDVPKNVTKLSLLVKAADYPSNITQQMGQPKAKVDVELTHINATNILAIHEKETPVINCFENAVSVYFTAPKDSEVEMSYYVSSAATILQSGREVVSVGSEDLLDAYTGGANLIEITEKNPNQTAAAGEPERILSKAEIAISRPFEDDGKVTSKIKVLVFIKGPDGKILSDVREYAADSCLPQPVVKFSRAEARPGDAAKLTIAGEGDAYCGYSVVDKSVALTGNENKVTAARLQKLREALAKSRVDNDQPSRIEGCKGTTYLFKSFARLGLYIMSDQLVDLSKCQPIVDLTKKKRPGFTKARPAYVPPKPFDPSEPEAGPIPYDQNAEAQDYLYEEDYYSEDYSGGFAYESQAQAAPQVAFAASADYDEDNDGTLNANRVVATSSFSSSQKKKTSVQRRPASQPQRVRKNQVQLRDYFPETWLFDLVLLDGEGSAELDLKAPHTVTTWVADVFCSDAENGLTVANETSLTVTQDFFADLNMPYSVKRGEILPVNVSVFNQVERALPMKLSLDKSGEFKVDRAFADVCVGADDHTIETFKIKAKELNEVNITVEAQITDDVVVEGCQAEALEAEGFTDRLRKPIFVKPEGFPVEKVQTVFQCLNAEDKSAALADGAEAEGVEVALEPLELPGEDDLVEDSARAWVMVSGDIMAPAIANLERMLRIPYGCGEQNMISSAPNVYVMEYLAGTGKKDQEIEDKARAHIAKGFQRQQSYRHHDGGYSVWGNEETEKGSTWLTAFVLKVFSQATKFVNLPTQNLRESLQFLLRRQQKNGCFAEHGYSYSLRGDQRTLTATVLIALLEAQRGAAGLEVDQRALTRAYKCVINDLSEVDDDVYEDAEDKKDDEDEEDEEMEEMELDSYSKSIIAYALTLYDSEAADRPELPTRRARRSVADDLVNELMESANTSVTGQLFWNGRYNSRSKAVETTSYVVLSLVLKDRLPESLKAIKWVAAQRNGYGGFVSTQDTIVALSAIAQFSAKVSSETNDLAIAVTADDCSEHAFNVNDDNLLLLQRSKLAAPLPRAVSARASGQGCFQVQTLLRYNVKKSPNQKDFELTAELFEDGTLRLCSAYTGGKDATEMVVMELELLSGYVADEASLEALLNDAASAAPVKRYEYDEKEGRVALYFDAMPAERTCWQVQLQRRQRVEKLQPAVVQVYDYYNQEDITEVEYKAHEKEQKPEVIDT